MFDCLAVGFGNPWVTAAKGGVVDAIVQRHNWGGGICIYIRSEFLILLNSNGGWMQDSPPPQNTSKPFNFSLFSIWLS